MTKNGFIMQRFIKDPGDLTPKYSMWSPKDFGKNVLADFFFESRSFFFCNGCTSVLGALGKKSLFRSNEKKNFIS